MQGCPEADLSIPLLDVPAAPGTKHTLPPLCSWLFPEQVWKLPAFGHAVPLAGKALSPVESGPCFKD